MVIEVKKTKKLLVDHKGQTLTYLRDSGLAVGLLLNFGGEQPEFKRIFEPGNIQPGEA